MAYRTEIGGMKIECDTVAELRQLVSELGGGAVLPDPKPDFSDHGPRRNGHSPQVAATNETAGRAAERLLTVVNHAGQHGVVNDTLVSALKLKQARGLGPFMQHVGKQLASIGMNADDVVSQRRTSEGRRWFAGPRITEALAKLQGHEP